MLNRPNVPKVNIVFMGLALLLVVALILASWKDGGTQIGSKSYNLEVVSTPADMQLGLSGREDLSKSGGMLFDFGFAGQHSIWMKDMNFSIDILWLDQSGKVVYVVNDAAPDSYPATFTSENPASYVVELHSLALEENGVKVGDTIEL